MAEQTRIAISDLVPGGICVAVEDGQTVYSLLSDAVRRGDEITLSFKGVRRMTTAFLNAAVGQLYNEFDEDVVRRSLQVAEIDPISAVMVQRVVERAKRFFKDRKIPTESTKKILEEDNG